MVNKDPDHIDEDSLPTIDEPLHRETIDNMLLGVWSTETDGVWRLDVRDWMNRVIESTVYEKDRDEVEEQGGAKYEPLRTPEGMTDEPYLNELLTNRLERIEEEQANPGNTA